MRERHSGVVAAEDCIADFCAIINRAVPTAGTDSIVSLLEEARLNKRMRTANGSNGQETAQLAQRLHHVTAYEQLTRDSDDDLFHKAAGARPGKGGVGVPMCACKDNFVTQHCNECVNMYCDDCHPKKGGWKTHTLVPIAEHLASRFGDAGAGAGGAGDVVHPPPVTTAEWTLAPLHPQCKICYMLLPLDPETGQIDSDFDMWAHWANVDECVTPA